MEIIDRQRARDWIEQMDTILIFVRSYHLRYPFFNNWLNAGRIIRRLPERLSHRTSQSA
jgi:hypothetical protein